MFSTNRYFQYSSKPVFNNWIENIENLTWLGWIVIINNLNWLGWVESIDYLNWLGRGASTSVQGLASAETTLTKLTKLTKVARGWGALTFVKS